MATQLRLLDLDQVAPRAAGAGRSGSAQAEPGLSSRPGPPAPPKPGPSSRPGRPVLARRGELPRPSHGRTPAAPEPVGPAGPAWPVVGHQWRLDAHTREIGLRGVAEARRVLAATGRGSAA